MANAISGDKSLLDQIRQYLIAGDKSGVEAYV